VTKEIERTPDDDAPDPAFEMLWARVLEAWDDPKTHRALLEYALQKQLLPQAAGKYRELRDHPDKGVEAKKRLEGIVVATTSLLMSTATPRTAVKTSLKMINALAFVLVVFVLFWLARAMLNR
jgi:hypothetical protein